MKNVKEINVITASISAEFLTPAGVRLARPALIALQEVTASWLVYLQGELPGFTPLTVPVVDPDPAMTAVWSAKYGRCGLPELPTPYEITATFLDALGGWGRPLVVRP